MMHYILMCELWHAKVKKNTKSYTLKLKLEAVQLLSVLGVLSKCLLVKWVVLIEAGSQIQAGSLIVVCGFNTSQGLLLEDIQYTDYTGPTLYPLGRL